MEGLASAWSQVTEAQATIIAAGLTVAAAAIGVLIGSWLFGGKVKDLRAALAESADDLSAHSEEVGRILDSIQDQMGQLDEQASSMTRSLADIQTTVADLQNQSDTTLARRAAAAESSDPGVAAAEAALDAGTDAKEDEWASWYQLRDDWHAIRDRLEDVAANPETDGRKRAKYGRIDRRQYALLIQSLEEDGLLGSDGGPYRRALGIWQTYKNARNKPTEGDLEELRVLRRDLLAKPIRAIPAPPRG